MVLFGGGSLGRTALRAAAKRHSWFYFIETERMMNARKNWMVVALVLLLAGSGCSSRLVKATGKLTYKGQPVPSIRVTFFPDDESRKSSGLTDDNGNFTLQYSRTEVGVTRGPKTVFLKYEMSPEEELHQVPPKVSKELQAIIAKYGDPKKSSLHYEVTKSGQHFDIDLE
jgi:hypothetical protein